MRILLTIVHFFRATDAPRFSSEDASKRDERARVIRAVIDSWRGHIGLASEHNVHFGGSSKVLGSEDGLDIVIMTYRDDHLLNDDFCAARSAKIVNVNIENPRMLGFTAHQFMADHRNQYDMFIYSEDDLKILDGMLPARIMGFQEKFGYRRLLQPNRFEWNVSAASLKTYIDGYIPPDWIDPYVTPLIDEDFLHHPLPARLISCRRAINPHAGFFAITAEQLHYWIGKPYFGDLDCSFVSPLESAATLGMMKTFAVYKPFGRDAGFLEIEHMDNRYSSE